jgi:hypothetical protein
MGSLLQAPVDLALVAKAVGILVLLALARFSYRLYEVRTLVRKAAREDGVVRSICWRIIRRINRRF